MTSAVAGPLLLWCRPKTNMEMLCMCQTWRLASFWIKWCVMKLAHLIASALCCRLKSRLFLSLRRSPSSRRTWRNCSVCQAAPLILHQELISPLVATQHPNWRRHTNPWSSKKHAISPSPWWRFLSSIDLIIIVDSKIIWTRVAQFFKIKLKSQYPLNLYT